MAAGLTLRRVDKALDTALVWFRRDLRAEDHAALFHALKAAHRVHAVFVLDRDILDPLLARSLKADRRVEFIRDSLVDLDSQLHTLGQAHGATGAGLIVLHGHARDEIPLLANELHVQAVYANHDDEPVALARDAQVRGRLSQAGIAMHTSKDHLIFERSEVMSAGETPLATFAAYRNTWLKRLVPASLNAYPVATHGSSLVPLPERWRGGVPAVAEIGFESTNLQELKITPGSVGAQALFEDFLQRIHHYDQTRDFPAVKGPSYLSTHLRFGTLSIRQLAREAHRLASAGSKGAELWLDGLIRRDFYHQILHHYPHVVSRSFHAEYDAIRWEQGRQARQDFAAWSEGRTGYPLVDAAMAQINQTGYMHYRLRVLVAGFLVKHLGIDWRRGERYFADRLNDFDLAVNNGGWQWAAGTGCDAQSHSRIVDPIAQSRKLDPGGKFIRRYLPQLSSLSDESIHAPWRASPADLSAAGVRIGSNYPSPIVEHEAARARASDRYSAVKAHRS